MAQEDREFEGAQAVRPLRREHREERRGVADVGATRAAAAQAAATAAAKTVRCPDSSASRQAPARLAARDADRPDAGCAAAARSSSTACDEALMSPFAAWMLTQEARALQTRLGRVRPFALLEPMVPAAALLPHAQSAIEELPGRRPPQTARAGAALHRLAARARPAQPATPTAQRRFSILRLKFNAVLTQFDLFSDVITQRSEHETGVWLSGLDVASADALALPGARYRVPPVICYLDRGAGAAIRRARTRLPGGGDNPVAIIRVPRERMVGSGIASSLFHEVGHQADALLDLVGIAAADAARHAARRRRDDAPVWQDSGSAGSRRSSPTSSSVARVGIASSMGLIGVVSLPRAFVFRLNLDDPHPVPWIRVKLSCAIGEALHPHPQWRRLADLWESFYPIAELDAERRGFFEHAASRRMPAFVSLLVNHRPRAACAGGRSPRRSRSPSGSRRAWPRCFRPGRAIRRSAMYARRPSLVFAVVGQARSDGLLTPEDESVLLAKAAQSLGAAQHARYGLRVRNGASRASAIADGHGAAGTFHDHPSKEIDMGTYDRADKSQRGGIVVSVADDGHPVTGASVSLYKAPAALKSCPKFAAQEWQRGAGHPSRYSADTGQRRRRNGRHRRPRAGPLRRAVPSICRRRRRNASR